MTAVSNGLLVWATDPEVDGYDTVFDFITGQIVLAYGTEVEPEPEPAPQPVRGSKRPPIPRGSSARNVRLTLTADLGSLVAHANARIELADEELIELL